MWDDKCEAKALSCLKSSKGWVESLVGGLIQIKVFSASDYQTFMVNGNKSLNFNNNYYNN